MSIDADELIRETLHTWRYHCGRHRCGYYTRPMTLRAAESIRRIHRHRHFVGRAGTYHLERE